MAYDPKKDLLQPASRAGLAPPPQIGTVHPPSTPAGPLPTYTPQEAGALVRGGVNKFVSTAADGLTSLGNVAKDAASAVATPVAGFVAGFTGRPRTPQGATAPTAPSPTGMPSASPVPAPTPSPDNPAPSAPVSPGSANPTNVQAGPPANLASPLPNTFNGRSVKVSPTDAAPTPFGIPAATAPVTADFQRNTQTPFQSQVAAAQNRNQATFERANQVTARDFGAPDNAELLRRLEHRLGSKMTRTERQGLIGAYQQQIGAIAGSQAQATQNDATANAATAAQGARASEVDANNAAAAQRQQIEGGFRRAAVADAANAPQQFADASGNLFVRRGDQATAVTGADGKPIRTGVAPVDGQITPAIAFKQMNEEIAALSEFGSAVKPEERENAITSIRQRYAPYLGQQAQQTQGAAPTIEQFMTQARQANPGASDAELQAYYKQNYGG